MTHVTVYKTTVMLMTQTAQQFWADGCHVQPWRSSVFCWILSMQMWIGREETGLNRWEINEETPPPTDPCRLPRSPRTQARPAVFMARWDSGKEAALRCLAFRHCGPLLSHPNTDFFLTCTKQAFFSFSFFPPSWNNLPIIKCGSSCLQTQHEGGQGRGMGYRMSLCL